MTRLLLTLLTILSFSFLANAQFTKGNLVLGGTLSYSGSSSKFTGFEQTNHGGDFNVLLGKAISENSVFGLNLGYSFNSSGNSMNSGTNKNNGYTLGVFYRKYKTLGKDFYIFGAAGAGYNGSTASVKDYLGNEVSSGTLNGGYLSFSPGIDYKISNKFLLEISIPSLFSAQYSSTKTTNQNAFPQTATGSQFGITTSLSAGPFSALGIGFILVL